MSRYAVMVALLMTCIILRVEPQVEERSVSNAGTWTPDVSITQTELRITDRVLEVHYQITNDSTQDIWLCEDVNIDNLKSEMYLAEDNQTLIVRRRCAVPREAHLMFEATGRYRRLRAGESRSECLLLTLPIRRATTFYSEGHTDGIVHAARVVFEIGFYPGDLLAAILESVNKPQGHFLDVFTLSSLASIALKNEQFMHDRTEQVLFSSRVPVRDEEQVLRITLENQCLPYDGERTPFEYTVPNVRACTRAEVTFRPSMLEFFFQYTDQQNLLSPAERGYLKWQTREVIGDPERIRTFVDHFRLSSSVRSVVSGESVAHIACYRNEKQATSFNVHLPDVIELEDGQGLRCWHLYEMFEALVPAIRPFDLRLRCARNLQGLWYRLRIRHRFRPYSIQGETVYPSPTEWCDALMIFQRSGYPVSPWTCPCERHNGSHYAMNVDCQFDSPPNTVLLFEAASGWNQHGGPELFIFDRHEPRGGLVLLNDGTVKFIRTEEELKQLRWE